MSNHVGEWLGTAITVVFALTLIFVRLRGSNKPVTAKSIIMPPIGMSTGFLMFIVPETHDKLLYALLALAVGVVLSYPLILTSKLHSSDGQVYMKRSKAYVVILLGFLVLRLILRQYIEQYVTLPQTGSLFFILAFGMILPWRVAILLRFQKYMREIRSASSSGTRMPSILGQAD